MISIDGITLQYSNMGLFFTEEVWTHPERTIDTYEIIHVVNGEFSIREDETIYKLKPKTTLILQPFHTHGGVAATNGTVRFYWLHFYAENLEKLNLKKINYDNEMNNSLFLLRELMSMERTGGRSICDIKLAEILFKLSDNERKILPKSVSEISEYIKINSNKRLTTSKISELYGYSADHLSRLFKRFMGLSLQEYINRERISQIKALVLNTNYSIKEISYLCDFSDENLFLKFFKYHTGKTPTEYKILHSTVHMNNK